MPPKDWLPFTVEDALSIRSFPNRSLIRFSPDGRLIAYTLEDRSGDDMRTQLWISDVETGEANHLLPEATCAWGPSWSPTGNLLAFYVDTGEGLQLWVWDAETDETGRVSLAIIASVEPYEVARWLPDGSAVVCKVANSAWLATHHPSGPKIVSRDATSPTPSGRTTVRCWESGLQPDTSGEFEAQMTSADIVETLARINIATGRLAELADGPTLNWAVSPDGESAAFTRFLGDTPASAGYRFDLCAFPCTGGELVVLAQHLVTWSHGPAFSWSPDGTMIAYRIGDAVSVVSLAGAAPRPLFGTENGSFLGDSFNPPLWSRDGAYVLVAQDTVWRLPVAGGEPLDLMPNRGRIMALDTILTPGGGTEVWSPDGESIIALAVDLERSARILVKLGLTGAGILAKSCDLQDVTWAPRFSTDVSPANRRISFVREDGTHPPDIWCIDLGFSSPRRLTNVNPHVEGSMFGEPRMLDWTGPGGRPCQSGFFPPPDRYGPPPWPTVFRVYEGRRSEYIDVFGGEEQRIDNLHILGGHGYAVCIPDIPVSQQHPAQSIRVALECAVKTVVDAGLADPKRLGVFGHSYGGYVVNVAITGLDCFAAAVASAGWSNLTSRYGAGRDGEGYEAYLIEHAQGRMGAPPWENPQRYTENSPLFFLDRVTTPLLILHGAEDIALSQAWEIFNGLRRLNKPAVLAIYDGEEHCLERRANIIDRWQRVLAWFDKYLRPTVLVT